MHETRESPSLRLGLIVNPIAGMGGRVALKGTDGTEALRRARERGATPMAATRADRALSRLEGLDVSVVAAPGIMGADLAAGRHFSIEAVGSPHAGPTVAADTRAAAGAMLRRGVDLLLFAGGDGTARDIHAAVGTDVAVLGIPTGVKMHSGVFAASPEAAGDVAAAFLRNPENARIQAAEVADVDEDAIRDDRIATQLYGELRVPVARSGMVRAKQVATADGPALDALARTVARDMEPGRVYLIGPGTTTRRVLDRLGLEGTLLGVDVVRNGELIAADADEGTLLDLTRSAPATIIAGVIGGQGFVLGRGNQQISADVIRQVGADNLMILADERKLAGLQPPRLRVDTGDAEVDQLLTGYRKVFVGPSKATVLKLATQ